VSDKKTTRQRELMIAKQGKPVLSLEFDCWGDPGEVRASMWTHTPHGVPFSHMKEAFEVIRSHLESFIGDGDMCPFNPDFLKDKESNRLIG